MKKIFGLKKSGAAAPAAPPDSAYADVQEKNLSKVAKAAWTGDADKLVAAIKKGNVDETDAMGRSALHLAAFQGHRACLEKLVAAKAKFIQDSEGMTPLMRALERRHTGCVQILIQSAAHMLNAANLQGQTAVHLAVLARDTDALAQLITARANYNVQDMAGRSPLHVAVLEGNSAAARQLLNAGASSALMDKMATTALMVAAEHGNREITELLLSKGASTSARNFQGWTARDYALAGNHRDVAKLLGDADAEPAPSITPTGSARPSVSRPAPAPPAPQPAKHVAAPEPESEMSETDESEHELDLLSDSPELSRQPPKLNLNRSSAPPEAALARAGQPTPTSAATMALAAAAAAKARERPVQPPLDELDDSDEPAAMEERPSFSKVTLDPVKTPNKALYSPHGSVMGHSDAVKHGSTLIGMKLGTLHGPSGLSKQAGADFDEDDEIPLHGPAAAAGPSSHAAADDDFNFDDEEDTIHGDDSEDAARASQHDLDWDDEPSLPTATATPAKAVATPAKAQIAAAAAVAAKSGATPAKAPIAGKAAVAAVASDDDMWDSDEELPPGRLAAQPAPAAAAVAKVPAAAAKNPTPMQRESWDDDEDEDDDDDEEAGILAQPAQAKPAAAVGKAPAVAPPAAAPAPESDQWDSEEDMPALTAKASTALPPKAPAAGAALRPQAAAPAPSVSSPSVRGGMTQQLSDDDEASDWDSHEEDRGSSKATSAASSVPVTSTPLARAPPPPTQMAASKSFDSPVSPSGSVSTPDLTVTPSQPGRMGLSSLGPSPLGPSPLGPSPLASIAEVASPIGGVAGALGARKLDRKLVSSSSRLLQDDENLLHEESQSTSTKPSAPAAAQPAPATPMSILTSALAAKAAPKASPAVGSMTWDDSEDDVSHSEASDASPPAHTPATRSLAQPASSIKEAPSPIVPQTQAASSKTTLTTTPAAAPQPAAATPHAQPARSSLAAPAIVPNPNPTPTQAVQTPRRSTLSGTPEVAVQQPAPASSALTTAPAQPAAQSVPQPAPQQPAAPPAAQPARTHTDPHSAATPAQPQPAPQPVMQFSVTGGAASAGSTSRPSYAAPLSGSAGSIAPDDVISGYPAHAAPAAQAAQSRPVVFDSPPMRDRYTDAQYEDLAARLDKDSAELKAARLQVIELEQQLRTERLRVEDLQTARVASESTITQLNIRSKDAQARADSAAAQLAAANLQGEQLRADRTSMLAQMAGLREENETLRAQLADYEHDATLHKQFNNETARLHSVAVDQAAHFAAQIESLKAELAEARDAARRADQSGGKLQLELEALRAERDAAQRSISTQGSEQQAALARLRDEVRQREQAQRTAEQEAARIQRDVDAANRALREERETADGLRAQLSTGSSRIVLLQTRAEDAEKALERAQQALADESRTHQHVRDTSKTTIAALETQLADLRVTMAELRSKHSVGEDTAADLQSRLAQARADLAQRSAEITVLRCDAEQKGKVVAELEMQVRTERDAHSAAASQVRRDADRLRQSEESLAAARKDIERLKAAATQQDEQARDSQDKLTALFDTQRAALQADIGRLGKQLGESQAALSQAESMCRRTQDENARLKQALEGAKYEIAQQHQSGSSQAEEIARLRDAVRAAEASKTSTGSALSEARAKLDEAAQREAGLRRELAERSVGYGELEASVRALQQQNESRAQEIDKLVQAKRDLESMLVKTEERGRALDGQLHGEQVQRTLLESGLGSVQGQRGTAERLLAELAAENSGLREKLRTLETSAAENEQRANECRRLWEAEVNSRSKLGARMLDLEKQLADTRAAQQKEERRVAKAMERKHVAEERVVAAERQLADVQAENTQLAALVKRAKQKLRDQRANGGDSERARDLQDEVRRLQDDLRREQSLRTHAMQAAADMGDAASNAHTQQAMAALAAQRAADAEAARNALEGELQRLRNDVAANYVPRGELARTGRLADSAPATRAPDLDALRRHEQLLRELAAEKGSAARPAYYPARPPVQVTYPTHAPPSMPANFPAYTPAPAGPAPSYSALVPSHGTDALARYREAWASDMPAARAAPSARPRPYPQPDESAAEAELRRAEARTQQLLAGIRADVDRRRPLPAQ
eukprot:m.255732 g.255732  ORF g.255732 m.255732 type:complete len:2101 (+) comp19687_c0_seq1:2-6304(+)